MFTCTIRTTTETNFNIIKMIIKDFPMANGGIGIRNLRKRNEVWLAKWFGGYL